MRITEQQLAEFIALGERPGVEFKPSRPRGERRAFARVAFAVICFSAIPVACDSNAGSKAPSAVSTDCSASAPSTLDPNAYLPQPLRESDLNGYTLIVDIPGSDPRRHPCGLIAKRTDAFVIDDAVTGPGRAEVDAYSRQLGYPITAHPLIPIQGPFVLDHQGVFDAQAQATAFVSSADAQSYADHLWIAAEGPK